MNNLLNIVENSLYPLVDKCDKKQFDISNTIKKLNEYSTLIIKKKFKAINKDDSFEFDNLQDSSLEKGFHSIVLYLLGLETNCIFKGAIENYINAHFKENGMENILGYIWKLTSLYHDVMANYENHEKDIIFKYLPYIHCPLLSVESFLNTCDEIKFKGIKHTIYKDDYMVNLITRKIVDRPFDYTYKSNEENIVNRYFRKRLHMDCLDHGIISGYVFYNQLIESYLKKVKQQHIKDFDKEFDAENDEGEKIKYRPVHLLLFKYIADAIIVHNIWHYNNKTKKEYKLWGLGELSAKYKLNLKDNPLAFMLGVLDTIEPVKYFCKDDKMPKDVLNKINIDWSEKQTGYYNIVLTLDEKAKNIDFDDWYDHKLRDMKDWLDLAVRHKKRSNKITITIKSQETKNQFR